MDIKKLIVSKEFTTEWTDGGNVCNSGYFNLNREESDALCKWFAEHMEEVRYGTSVKVNVSIEING